MPKPTYLDLKTLAAYASCSVRWLRYRLKDPWHPLPHYRIRGKLLVRREEFDAWITRYRVCRRGEDLTQLVDQIVASVCARSGGR